MTWRRPIVSRVGLIALLIAAQTACHKKSDPVRECLDDLARAVHDRSVDALFARVANDFQAEDGSSRADAESLARRYFAAYESLNVTISQVQIERGDSGARARFRAELSGQPRKIGGLDQFFPRTSVYDFDIRLVSEGGEWKVAWASWRSSSR